MTREEFREISWAGFITYAVNQPEIIRAYEADTGNKFIRAAKTSFEAAVDEATGVQAEQMDDLVRWITINMWGIDEAPAKFREQHGG